MRISAQATRRTLTLAAIAILLISFNAFASAPTVTKDPVKFVRYNCVDVGINLVVPEDWTYEEEFSTEEYYLFFGPKLSQYVEMSVNTIPEGQSWPVSDIAYLYYNLSVDSYGYVPLSLPSVLQFGDKFGMICGYVENVSENEFYVIIDVLCIWEDKLVILTISDEINSFVENVQQYDVILSSFTSNPSAMGTLEKFFMGMLPADTSINVNLLQGN